MRDFCGHGLGRVFHDAPTILHYVEPAYNVELKPGMIFTVEPMINLGRPHVKVLSDGWTAVTRDRSLSAQFEHTVGVTETGVRDLHPLAQGPGPAAYADRRMSERADDAAPLSTATATGCAPASPKWAAMPCPITSCSNSFCSARSRAGT